MRPLRLAVLVLAAVTSGHAHSVSSRRGQNRRLQGATVAETVRQVPATQCQLICLQRGDCRSFNHHWQHAICEIFTATVCDHHSYYLTSDEGWTWYDVLPDIATQSSQRLWNDSICVNAGRCRDDICLRRLEESCRENNQCSYHVTGSTACSGNKCVCTSSYWKYNTTLCESPNINVVTDGEHWVWKKIVNNMCNMEFEAQADDDLRFVLAEGYTHYSNRYHFRIGYDGNKYSYAERIQEGVSSNRFSSYSGALLDGGNYRRYGVHWCSGQIRFTRPGIDTYISWDDGARFSPAYIGIWTTKLGRWRFNKDLVDPWMEEWSNNRVYEIPKYSLLLRRQTKQDYWVEFDCRARYDCNWVASDSALWDGSHMYNVIIGGWENKRSEVQRHTPGVGWWTMAGNLTEGIVGRGEFIRFRIHFENGRVRVYAAWPNKKTRREERQRKTSARGKEAQWLILDGTDPSPFTIGYDGPRSCCDQTNMMVRLAAYDGSWRYEEGYRSNDILP